jgi:predicted  nucleic acid-binding Zn-ribbon protein
MAELSNLREVMSRMRAEMEDFKDLDGLRRDFDNTHAQLTELKQTYVKRKDAMRQQIQSITVEHETLKKSLNSHDIAREIDDTERILKQKERAIFDLKDFVDSKSRETDYGKLFISSLFNVPLLVLL